jgi:integration host factor subunit beta
MNKSDLIYLVKARVDSTAKDAEKIVDTFFNTITESIAGGGRVEIRGFGSFSVKAYKPYMGINPKTGKKIPVPAKKLPFFKIGKELKDRVDN